ncbi:hypothetical protein [Paenibacillus lemnae]|uniref:Uncharacterized protein n=1 Tax=Paenibacillus lemnae TaxID=1330551 RepID=A0A848MBI7_PAELE|nr:hypothetical protein [Paenibacillus lemnae]NMO97876.1 hypothetical protein [Paenibacillus lemnae]
MKLKEIQFNDWIIELDLHKTGQYYTEHDIKDDCSCNACNNYRVNCEYMSSELMHFFHRFRIDPRKEGEFMNIGLNDNGEVHYMGFYHIVGVIKIGPTKITDKWNHMNLIKIDNYEFAFGSDNIACVPEDFPIPILQLEFSSSIPWRIEEKYE